MKSSLYKLLLTSTLFLVAACDHTKRKSSTADDHLAAVEKVVTKPTNYIIYSAEKSETSNKAQMKVMAYLSEGFKDKPDLEETLRTIYESYRHQGGYTNFPEPTVVGVYLFESEKLTKTDPSSWIAMLTKGPRDDMPYISFNDLKVKASLGLRDSVLSEDEIQLAKIKKLLDSRKIDMCELNKMLSNLELNSIHAADKQYPDYGSKHGAYADKLMDQGRKELERKYRLTEKEIGLISAFATVYCK